MYEHINLFSLWKRDETWKKKKKKNQHRFFSRCLLPVFVSYFHVIENLFVIYHIWVFTKYWGMDWWATGPQRRILPWYPRYQESALILIVGKLSCAFSCAMLECSVSWVSSIMKAKASIQEVPALTHSLTFPAPLPPLCLVLYPQRVKALGRPDHRSTLRGIDVCTRRSSRFMLHTVEPGQNWQIKKINK